MTAKINPTLVRLAVPIGRLHEDPKNARLHGERNLAAITASLQQFGAQKPVVALKDGTVIAGSGTLRAAKALGWEKLPVVWFDSREEARARAYALADNRTAELAEWHVPVLQDILADLKAGGWELDRTLAFSEDDLARLATSFEHAQPPVVQEDAVPELPSAPTVQRGQLWRLGAHRLLCGDSAERGDFDRLLAGAPVHLVHTDPPYGVNVEPRSNRAIAAAGPRRGHHQSFDAARMANRGVVPRARGPLRPKDRPLLNDFVTPEEFDRLLRLWFGHLAAVLLPGRAFYVWGGYTNLANYPAALKAAGLYFSQGIVWQKGHPVMTRKDFLGDFELCFYGWKEGAAHYFADAIRNVSDVWNVRKVTSSRMVHLTEKPVELAARAMTYSSRPGEHVLDLFGGSGSTLMAAEQMNRQAFVMELDPAYCDVIVQRWERFTGQRATLVPSKGPRGRARR